MNALELCNVCYRYGAGTPFQKDALKQVNAAFAADCITGIIGHTGSGKSTLVQLLNGLLRPDSGTVRLFGEDIWEKPKQIRRIRFRVGLVFQYPEYQLFEETVEADIAYGCKNMGLPPQEIAARVREALAFTGMGEEFLSRSPFELSGGQKRRVAVAGVMAMRPEVLILDEPAAGLDPMGREEILGGIRSYQKETHCTVLLVSHSMEDMARYADRLLVLSDGEVFAEGETAAVFSRAEALRSVGLDIPAITRLCILLRKNGICLPDFYTVEGAAAAILDRLHQKGGDGTC